MTAGLVQTICDASVLFVIDGMATIVSSANSEQCSLPISFSLEKDRSDAALLSGISRFMTADTISVRILL